MVMSGGHRSLSSYTLMRVGLGCIVLLLVVALGAAFALIEFKTGVRAYVTGESRGPRGGRRRSTTSIDTPIPATRPT